MAKVGASNGSCATTQTRLSSLSSRSSSCSSRSIARDRNGPDNGTTRRLKTTLCIRDLHQMSRISSPYSSLFPSSLPGMLSLLLVLRSHLFLLRLHFLKLQSQSCLKRHFL